MRALVLACGVVAALTLTAPGPGAAARMTEVVVALDAPSLANAVSTSRVLSRSARERRLDLDAPLSRGYLRELETEQDAVVERLATELPHARVRWRYSVVLNGLAIWLPSRELPALRRVEGIARIYAPGSYRTSLDRSPQVIGADDLWNDPVLPSRGEGVKIGIIDDGVDPTHPFFDPAGYAYPPGFPRGDRAYTTPKIIAARAFAPPTTTWKNARLPFDPQLSEHGTHVAGIAAGNSLDGPVAGRSGVSGVAPRAYIGNYKALSTPSAFGLIDNAAEVVAAIEAAVRDGMDVINMSFGEFESDPRRNPVDAAVNGAAAAGVVPVAAAGNSFDELGPGSIGSPGTAARALAVGATTKTGVLAGFSSGGPSALSQRLKPEVSAPGVAIFSSIPGRLGGWSSFSGTSMAAPHVAGAAALLRQRHPEWTVNEVVSALVTSAGPVEDTSATGAEAPASRQGGGLVALTAGDDPQLFAYPYALSFGLPRPGAALRASVALDDAGGGAGAWSASVRLQVTPDDVRVTVPRTVVVPGTLQVDVAIASGAPEGDVTGFVVLERSGLARRIPLWFRVDRPSLPPPARVLPGQGRYEGNNRRSRTAVTAYRYPDVPGVPALRGPEQVFRVRVRGFVANLGVRVVTSGRGVRVAPRIVSAGNESRLAGVPALPMDVNPYRDTYGETRPVAAVTRPSPGAYDLVFDTAHGAGAGAYGFRVWLDDTTPPRIRLVTQSVRAGGDVVLAVADGGSGVDPRSVRATVDGRRAPVRVSGGRVRVLIGDTAGRGRHSLVVSVADFQETKNSESVLGILPNTSVLRTPFRVQ